jgi:hypothetical protein
MHGKFVACVVSAATRQRGCADLMLARNATRPACTQLNGQNAQNTHQNMHETVVGAK